MKKKKCPHAVALGKRNRGVRQTMSDAAIAQRKIAALASAKVRSARAKARAVRKNIAA